MTSPFQIVAESKECRARLGIFHTARGPVRTPVFMPVGTQGTIKAIESQVVSQMGAEIILANTYHLYLRPGVEVLKKAGGLHKFMGWGKAILTDSGGFQVMSLSPLRKVTDEGVEFRSHIDGSSHLFTPESVIRIQKVIGSDIIMPLDECISYPAEDALVRKAVERTYNWYVRSRKENDSGPDNKQSLFGIIQGGTSHILRKKSAFGLLDVGVEGLALGGLSVGEPKLLMLEVLEELIPNLPSELPRYFMGIGKPEDLFYCVERGIDMMDCVLPTRIARNGTIFSKKGRIVLKNACYKDDFSPPDPACSCPVCLKHTRAYLAHLFRADEILGPMLATIHNLYFMFTIMAEIRDAIGIGTYLAYQRIFFDNYFQGSPPLL